MAELRLTFPTASDDLRSSVASELRKHKIEFTESPYGMVFEKKGPSPGVLGRTLKISKTDIVVIGLVLNSLVGIAGHDFDAEKHRGIKIQTETRTIELRGSDDVDDAIELLKEVQESDESSSPSE